MSTNAKRFVFDIETPTKDRDAVALVHMLSIMPLNGSVRLCETFSDHPLANVVGTLQDGLKRLSEADVIIGHNIINYDLPVLTSVLGYKPPKNQLTFDTLIASRYLDPDRTLPNGYPKKSAPHSLDAWGYRFGRYKPDHQDWSVISDEMIHRNREDCEITALLFDHITLDVFSKHDWSTCDYIEDNVARIITKQEITGVPFDVRSANSLCNELELRIQSIDDQLVSRLPSTVKPWGVSISRPFKNNGCLTKSCHDWFHDYQGFLNHLIGGPFTRIEYVPFKLGSQPQVKEWLLSIGWIPTEYNYANGERTSPKLTEDSFESITGDAGELFKARFLCNHRLSQIQGWLERVRDDGRISARANTCGTNTGRFRHVSVVNVPKASDNVAYGKQMRALFTRSSARRQLVGHDASGLELRMLAHYMNDPIFTEAVCNGSSADGTDIHTINQQLAELPTRDAAKTFIYAFIYGAGDQKLGTIVGGGKREGTSIRKRFLSNLERLAHLIDDTKRAANKGFLIGLDGRKVFMRKDDRGTIMEHKALNTQLQSAGAIVMKISMILLDRWVKEYGLTADKVLDMHDEAQADVTNGCVDTYKYLAIQSIVESGDILKLNLPLAAEAKSGIDWSKTH
jgi:DNA polymerase-1